MGWGSPNFPKHSNHLRKQVRVVGRGEVGISHDYLYKYINSSQLHTGIFQVQRSGLAGKSEVEPVLGAGDGGGVDRLLIHEV